MRHLGKTLSGLECDEEEGSKGRQKLENGELAYHIKVAESMEFIRQYITYVEKAMATHSDTHAWKIPWTEEPGRLQSMGSLRVGHD